MVEILVSNFDYECRAVVKELRLKNVMHDCPRSFTVLFL